MDKSKPLLVIVHGILLNDAGRLKSVRVNAVALAVYEAAQSLSEKVRHRAAPAVTRDPELASARAAERLYLLDHTVHRARETIMLSRLLRPINGKVLLPSVALQLRRHRVALHNDRHELVLIDARADRLRAVDIREPIHLVPSIPNLLETEILQKNQPLLILCLRLH